MSDNRTADFQKEQFETQQSVHYWAGRLIGHDQAYDIAGEIVEAIAYASQQTASLREELQRWRNQSDANEQCWKETVKDYNAQREVNKSLREELKNLEYELWVEVNLKKTFSMAVEQLQQELELKKERIDREVAYSEKLQEEVDRLRSALEKLLYHSVGDFGLPKKATVQQLRKAQLALSSKESKPS